jgi:hypothetical protein
MITSPVMRPPTLSVMWMALTVIFVSTPGVLVTICSLSTIVPIVAIGMVVFGGGLTASGLPPADAPTNVLEPVEPSPFEVHVAVISWAVSAPVRRLTLATSAELVEKPPWLPRFPPSLLTSSTPAVSTGGPETLAAEVLTFPPLPGG